MKSIMSIGAALIFAMCCVAQTTLPPPQPASGPGGSDYLHASMSVTRYLVNGTDVYWLYLPAEPVADSAVLIGCFRGSGNPPTSEEYGRQIGEYFWVRHLVRKGYVVVYPHSGTEAGIIAALTDAMEQVEQGPTRLYRDGTGRVRYGVTGNSLGGVNSFRMVATTAASFYPAEAAMPIHAADWVDLSTIAATAKIVQLCGNADANSHTNFSVQQAIWAKLQYLPCANRSFLQVRNHRSGNGVTVAADHLFPLTGTDSTDLSRYNVLDFYGSWRYSEALFNCAFFNRNCEYVFGTGETVTAMGEWSNGAPYLPTLVIDSSCYISCATRRASGASSSPVQLTSHGSSIILRNGPVDARISIYDYSGRRMVDAADPQNLQRIRLRPGAHIVSVADGGGAGPGYHAIFTAH